ncbi:hypothetical protein M433DRAFT_134665 [Acidomyces richmondensis BFW]|nr:hypothetical protein M433DRAFT_134665 [Acidomyces richmondensis BFW]
MPALHVPRANAWDRRSPSTLYPSNTAATATATSTRALALLHRLIRPRQETIAIPTVYQGLNAGPSPGAVVGIVLGSIAGFLLLLWLLWTLTTGSGFIFSRSYEEEDVYISSSSRRSRSPPERRRRRSGRREEMVSASRSPVRRERVIRQERIVRDVQPPREQSRIRETMYAVGDERRVEGDDVVEVMEEHSSVGGNLPPPRRKSRRSGSGYRYV